MIFAIFLFASAITAASTQQCNIQGECIGNIVGATSADSVIDCLKVCSEDVPNCTWFTFNLDIGYCGLQATCDYIDSQSCPTCISGESACSPNDFLSCELPGMCLGTILHQDAAENQQDCQDMCATYDGCNFYTYDATNAFCQLFATCPDQSEDFCQGCISGQPGCELGNGTEGEDFLLVVGGFNYSTHVDIVEVISLDPLRNPVPDCMKNLQPFPFPFVDAAGDTMDGKKGLNLFGKKLISFSADDMPMICGGYSVNMLGMGPAFNDKCWKYNPTNDSWTAVGTMSIGRAYMASSKHPSLGLVMAGGGSCNGCPIDSVEATKDGVNFVQLAPLDFPLLSWCMATLPSGELVSRYLLYIYHKIEAPHLFGTDWFWW